MSMFIKNDATPQGTGMVKPDEAFLSLVSISNNDPQIGEGPPSGDLLPVLYQHPLTSTGPCPTRLDTLVNDATLMPPIVVMAVAGSFMLNDGSSMSGNGVTLRPNETHGGINFNPSTSILVIYDAEQCGGTGICVKQEGSSDTVGSPNSVILFHELSHAFHIATGTTAATSAAEEVAAETDENLMRDQLGIAHRDVNDHTATCGTCGAPVCCVVATVATGSPYSARVNELRQVRDRFLRRAETGFSFFERLFEDYYAFSPQVCVMMARCEALRSDIERYYLAPLIHFLRLVQLRTVGHASPARLAAALDEELASSPGLRSLDAATLELLLDLYAGRSLPLKSTDAAHVELARLLEERALPSPYVDWALVHPVRIFLQAVQARRAGLSAPRVWRTMAAAMDQWAAHLPITDVWQRLSSFERRRELAFLDHCLLRGRKARRGFRRRLAATLRGRSSSPPAARTNEAVKGQAS